MKQLNTYAQAQDYSGKLLLAHPKLKDKNFSNTVVLASCYGRSLGTIGFVMNRPLNLTLYDFNASKWCDFAKVPVYDGGPVSRDKILLAGLQLDRKSNLLKLHVGLNKDCAINLMQNDPSIDLRAFVGYSIWGEMQLEKELHSNCWITIPFDPSYFVRPLTKKNWGQLMMKFYPLLMMQESLTKDPLLN